MALEVSARHFLKAVSWILDNLARGSQSKQEATSVGWTSRWCWWQPEIRRIPKWVKKCWVFCCFFQGPFRNTKQAKQKKNIRGNHLWHLRREHAQTRCKVDGVWRFHHLTTDSKIISFIVPQCSARHHETCENDAHNVNAKSHGLGFFVGPKGVTGKMGWYDNSWDTFPICFFPVSFFWRRKKAWKTRQKTNIQKKNMNSKRKNNRKSLFRTKLRKAWDFSTNDKDFSHLSRWIGAADYRSRLDFQETQWRYPSCQVAYELPIGFFSHIWTGYPISSPLTQLINQ